MRARYDTIVADGKVSLRFANRMMHLAYGRINARTAVIILIHGLHATTLALDGEPFPNTSSTPTKHHQAKQ